MGVTLALAGCAGTASRNARSVEHPADASADRSTAVATRPAPGEPPLAPVAFAQSRPAVEPAAPEVPRTAQVQPPPVVGLDGQAFLALIGASVTIDGVTVPCRIMPEPAASEPALERTARVFRLIPDDPRRPVCRCEVAEQAGVTILNLDSPARSVEIRLVAETLQPMLPVCLSPRDSDRVMNAALGPVRGDWFDGLFSPERDWAVALEGRVYCEELPDRTRLTVSAGPRDAAAPGLAIRSHRDFLKRQHGLTGYAPLSRRRVEPMPAAWMPLDTGRPPSPEDIARNTVWMAINLQPYGAASVLLPGTQSMLPTVRTTAVPSPSTVPPRPAGAPPAATSVSGWECFQQTAASLTSRFWGHGLLAQSMSSTLFVGEPLSPDQARLYASLIGLAGESPIACERMYALPDERIELLRRIIPAAPVRAVDLFAHPGLPPVWNLSVSNGAGAWTVLGLLNTSDEQRLESIELADLHLGTGAEQFAVYDVWERRLLRVVRDRFQVRVPATGCRGISLHRLAEDRPTIIGTDRHITCGGIDLHDVSWNEQDLTLSGQSDVVALDPYELQLYIPEGPASVEIAWLECAGAAVRYRAQGPLRTVTFESAASGPLKWRIGFIRVSQPPQSPPPRPRKLAARQNTRGVLLNWFQPDERVVSHHVYRNGRLLAEVEGCEYQDSTAPYNARHEYVVTAIDFCGRESTFSEPLAHVTPAPASTNLTQLVPLSYSQDQPPPGRDKSAAGTPLRIGGQRVYRGLGVTAPSRIVYFLGGGYELFSGSVGIDDSAKGHGSAVFRIIADGQTLFTSPVVRGGNPPLPFSTDVGGKIQLELVVSDAGDGGEWDYADWANPYLRAAAPASLPPAVVSPEPPVETFGPEPPPEPAASGPSD